MPHPHTSDLEWGFSLVPTCYGLGHSWPSWSGIRAPSRLHEANVDRESPSPVEQAKRTIKGAPRPSRFWKTWFVQLCWPILQLAAGPHGGFAAQNSNDASRSQTAMTKIVSGTSKLTTNSLLEVISASVPRWLPATANNLPVEVLARENVCTCNEDRRQPARSNTSERSRRRSTRDREPVFFALSPLPWLRAKVGRALAPWRHRQSHPSWPSNEHHEHHPCILNLLAPASLAKSQAAQFSWVAISGVPVVLRQLCSLLTSSGEERSGSHHQAGGSWREETLRFESNNHQNEKCSIKSVSLLLR